MNSALQKQGGGFFVGNRFESELIVVKIGTDTLVRDGVFDGQYAIDVAEQVSDIRQDGIDTILKSSGAIALGANVLGSDAARVEMSRVGQRILQTGWEEAFAKVGLKTQDILFVPGRLAEGDKQVRQALDLGRVPMSNGDDSSGVTHPDAHAVQNNDLLSARTAIKHKAHLLNLTKPDGVLNQQGDVMSEVSDIRQVTIFEGTSPNGTGGMLTKIESGLVVARTGLRVEIANGRKQNVISDFARKKQVGTRIARR